MPVLDASFLIALERGDEPARRVRADLQASNSQLRIPAAAWMEYLYSMPEKVRRRAEAELEDFATFEPFTRPLANLGVGLQHDLRRKGGMLSWMDLQIVCTALHHGEQLISNDADFDAIPGLARRGW